MKENDMQWPPDFEQLKDMNFFGKEKTTPDNPDDWFRFWHRYILSEEAWQALQRETNN